MEGDLHCIVDWGGKCLVSFNATKTKLLSSIRHQENIRIPLKITILRYLTILVPGFLDLFYTQVELETLCPVCCKTGITKSLFFDLRDTIHLFGVVLHNRVVLISLIRFKLVLYCQLCSLFLTKEL